MKYAVELGLLPEMEQEADFLIAGAKIVKELPLVRIGELAGRLDFHNETTVHEEIGAV